MNGLKCHNYLAWTVITFILCLIAVAIMLLASYQFLRMYRESKVKSRPGQTNETPISSFINVSIVFITVNILAVLSINYQLILCIFNTNSQILMSFTLTALFWTLNSQCILITFVIRLYTVFKGSVYAYSKNTFRFLGFAGTITLIFNLSSGVVFMLDLNFAFVISISGSCLYVILSLILVWLFVYGLFKVQATTRSRDSITRKRSKRGDHDITSKDISNIQLGLIKTMSRYVVLVSISLLTTIIGVGLMFAVGANASNSTNLTEGLSSNVFLFYASLIWFIIDLTTNVLCFLLQFQFFGYKIYYKYCQYIDQKCINIVKYFAIRQMRNERDKIYKMAIATSPKSPSSVETIAEVPTISPSISIAEKT